MVIAIAEHVFNHVLKRVLKPSTYRLQIFLVKYEYLRSSQLCEHQCVRVKPKKLVCNHVLTTPRLIWRPGLSRRLLPMYENQALFLKPGSHISYWSLIISRFRHTENRLIARAGSNSFH